MIYLDNNTDQQEIFIPRETVDASKSYNYYSREQTMELLEDTKVETLNEVGKTRLVQVSGSYERETPFDTGESIRMQYKTINKQPIVGAGEITGIATEDFVTATINSAGYATEDYVSTTLTNAGYVTGDEMNAVVGDINNILTTI